MTELAARARPDYEMLTKVVELAIRAPSIHNSQPWLWRINDDADIGGKRTASIDLFADRSRQLRIADSGGRALLVSCGAALYEAQVALSASGWRSTVTRFPNPWRDDHLATILVVGQIPATEEARRLAAAARRRRTDRRPFAEQSVDDLIITRLCKAAERPRAFLRQVKRQDDRLTLAVATVRADESETADPAYQAEVARWSGRSDESTDGIPLSAVPRLPDRRSDVALREFPGALRVPTPAQVERPLMAVIGTEDDSRLDRLIAGEALANVLLEVTDIGLAASPYTQPLEIPGPQRLMRRVLGGQGAPQILLRIGWPGPGDEPPLTPRRPVAEVLGDGPPARRRHGYPRSP